MPVSAGYRVVDCNVSNLSYLWPLYHCVYLWPPHKYPVVQGPCTYIWPVSAVWAPTNSNDGDAGKGDLGNGQTNLILVALPTQLEFCFDKIPPDLKSHFQKQLGWGTWL